MGCVEYEDWQTAESRRKREGGHQISDVDQKMLALVSAASSSWAAVAARPALHMAPRALTVRMQFASSIPQNLPDHLQDMAEEVCSGEATLFDVREPGEHAQGMLAIAQGLPLSMLQDGFFAGNDALDQFKTKTAYLHCAAGIRVHPAAACLQELGFERVVPLQEGFASLYQLGFPLKEE
jgi:rhodanese-related sulfurtransferase